MSTILNNHNKKSGFLLLSKPSGPTSHDIIYQLRRITGIKQIGHAGTLDPFANGLLLVAIGEATKLLRHYVGMDKEYIATLKLGAVSDTMDRTGKIQITNDKAQMSNKTQMTKSNQSFDRSRIQKVLKTFIGKQKQTPPMYSAKKVGGKKLYELAREGKTIERKAQDIEIYDIKLISYDLGLMSIICSVSSGTYIRTLAHDIGQALGCGAYLEALERTKIGDFKLEDAVFLTPANWHQHLIPLKTVLVSGTFDGVHEGHKNYFKQARAFGQRLICIVGRGTVVERIKGKPPHYSDKERIKMVKACDEIDRVFLGIDDTDEKVYDFVASLQPDVIALGYDQKAYTKNLKIEMKKRGVEVLVKRLNPFHPEKYKSSRLAK